MALLVAGAPSAERGNVATLEGLAAESFDEGAGLLPCGMPAGESPQSVLRLPIRGGLLPVGESPRSVLRCCRLPHRQYRQYRQCSVAVAVLLLAAAALVAVVWHPAVSSGGPRLGLRRFIGLSVKTKDVEIEADRDLRRIGGRRDPDSASECVIDAGVGSLYLARAGLEITAATDACAKYHSYKEELNKAMPKDAVELFKSTRGLQGLRGARASPGQAFSRAQRTWEDVQAWRLDSNLGRRLRGVGGLVNRSLGEGNDGHVMEDLKEAGDHMKEIGSLQRQKLAFQRVCAADIAGTFSSFSYVASYYSALVSQCQSKVVLRAYCTSDITKMLASLAEMAAGAAAISAQCTDLVTVVRDGEDEIERRRLSEHEVSSEGGDAVKEMLLKMMEKKTAHDFEAKRHKRQASACAVEVSQAVLFIAQFGLEAQGVHQNCWEGHQNVCSGNIAGMLSSLALISMMVSNAVGMCPEYFNFQAMCSSAISQLIAGIGELAASSFLLMDSCDHAALLVNKPAWEWSSDFEEDRGTWVDEYSAR